MRNLYLTNRFFGLFGLTIVAFLVAYIWDIFYPSALTIFLFAVALLLVDIFLLFRKKVKVKANRILPKLFSLSDENTVKIELNNNADLKLLLNVIDELPFQFQIRDFQQSLSLPSGEAQAIKYILRPVERGAYEFGNINVYASSILGIVERRFVQLVSATVPVYPSILQMKKYELQAFSKLMHFQGVKKMRRIGHSYEFEQIKNYVRGDDYRSINWKATGRAGALMVNQYEDERAQQIYCVIDKSRVMRMPFAGLSLMDYAINTCLVISNIAIKKHDRAGLITFSDKLGTVLKADSQPAQLNRILQALYKEKERTLEANYELLYYAARKLINGRSLFVLYTNFESSYALERVLPILRKINRFHLLLVVFFENTEIQDFIESTVSDVAGIYNQTIARRYMTEKENMVQKLKQYGIQAILTKPEELSINTLNKYLELKARGLI